MLKPNEKKLKENVKLDGLGYCGIRSLLINDEILVLSAEREILFYSISIANNDITDPKLLYKYKLQSYQSRYKFNCKSFRYHGMCCINFKKNETSNGSKYNCIAEILLFGGRENESSF